MSAIRRCGDETAEILAIINRAAEAHRGVTSPNRWHEPCRSEPHKKEAEWSGVLGFQMQGNLVWVNDEPKTASRVISAAVDTAP